MSGMTQSAEFQQRAAELRAARQALQGNPRQSRKSSEILGNARYPASIIGAFLTGMIAVAFARYIRFHLSGGTMAGEDADMTMMLDGAIGAAAGFFIRQMFKFEAKVFLTASNVGVGAMILTMHNLVHYAPAPFEIAFSPDWVREVVETTDPNTAVFGEFVFTFGGAEPSGAEPSGAEVAQAEADLPGCERQLLGSIIDRQAGGGADC